MADGGWQPLDSAPTDGRVIAGHSRDWGKKGSSAPTSIYRARWFDGAWRNADAPRETLTHLFEWQDAPPRSGLQQLLDSLPIDVLAGRAKAGDVVDLLDKIAMLLAHGEEHGSGQAIQALARAVHAAQGIATVQRLETEAPR